ncbi:MAG TPA: phosphoribosylformylglycinamidine cyclo-ligase [Candidatus Omnitrophota bacterium]|nr:phosphoribosylformylglycinamidine cyclo-ligase [Candidatus Omnitrophota bacterium]HPN88396.1 phosphoribosylformylglycinamidine cyclo-ligase [Candidatus Omnitrophota bacterium]
MKKITYKTSGVDIDKANFFIKSIKDYVKSTESPNVLKFPGAFGSLFAVNMKKLKNPVLVSSTDGVGTKLLVAKTIGKHDTVGIDLVAMNVNDVLCTGAQPLFFLDYIACGKLDPKVLKDVIKGITDGCREAGCSLVGGETAEMPGMYKKDDYDLAGFTVGIVEKSKIINGSKISVGDKLIGLPSSGLHSNGFSLVRKVFSVKEQKKYAKEILSPTRIYVKDVLPIVERFNIKGIAHITGGAFYEKLTKILPSGKCFNVNKNAWPKPKIFTVMQKKARIADEEMYRTFNMGIGLVLVVHPQEAAVLRDYLNKKKITHYFIGEVISHPTKRIIL